MSATPRTDREAWRYQDCNGDESWVSAEFARELEIELRAATIGRCTCSDCGKQVNNAWRDSDGHHCLTCLAKGRDSYRADSIRLKWLHTGSGKDSEGYEWGVARIKHDANGQVVSALWTLSDHSDLDAEMAREGAS